MESALNGLSQMAILIIVAAVGFLAAKLDYLDEYTNQKLTKLLLNITLPCMVIASVHGLSAADAGETVGITFAMAIGTRVLASTGRLALGDGIARSKARARGVPVRHDLQQHGLSRASRGGRDPGQRVGHLREHLRDGAGGVRLWRGVRDAR